jgi:hypothetical protein
MFQIACSTFKFLFTATTYFKLFIFQGHDNAMSNSISQFRILYGKGWIITCGADA